MNASPLTVPRRFRVIAHRGASGYAPENTHAAFALAAQMGVREVEFDLQFSQDGHIVLVHDPVLDRYGFPGCRVGDMTLAELKALDMGAWFGDRKFAGEKIVTLDEVLTSFGDRFIYHAEIKVPAAGLARLALERFASHGLSERMIVTSFVFDALREVAALSPGQRMAWLVRHGDFTPANVDRAAAAGVFQFCPRADETDVDAVAAAKARVPEIRAHGIACVDDLRQAVQAGCDGVTINWPDWLQHGGPA